MLKDLIRLFSDSFLKSKKSWVAEQCAPIVHNGTNIPCQAQRISLPTSRRATAGQHLGAIQAQFQLLKFKSRMGRWRLPLSLTETLPVVASAVTLKKEPLLNSYAEVERLRIILFGSTKQVLTLNSSTGGVLC
ncbi:hypothetical protein [Parasutterella sp.]|uniref:hypothetical protein n=1 Tax=Parasutterella sp. TaxID=2049037 RepID=UPI0035224018